MAAHIDLGWLASLLTPTPTATPNPEMNAQVILDAKGNPINTATNKPMSWSDIDRYGSQPLVPPSNWQNLVHPQQAGQINQFNNQYAMMPIEAQQRQLVGNQLGAQQAATATANGLPGIPGVTPLGEHIGLGGNLTLPSIQSGRRALAAIQAGAPEYAGASEGQVSQNVLDEATSAHALNVPFLEANQRAQESDYAGRRAYGDIAMLPEELAHRRAMLALGLDQATAERGLVPLRKQNEELNLRYPTHLLGLENQPYIPAVSDRGLTMGRNPIFVSPMEQMSAKYPGMNITGSPADSLAARLGLTKPLESRTLPLGGFTNTTPMATPPQPNNLPVNGGTGETAKPQPNIVRPAHVNLGDIKSGLSNIGLLDSGELISGYGRSARALPEADQVKILQSKIHALENIINNPGQKPAVRQALIQFKNQIEQLGK